MDLLSSCLLDRVGMSMGAAFGLSAVFSMLRDRIGRIPAIDMSYLFLVITIGLISAIGKGRADGWWGSLKILTEFPGDFGILSCEISILKAVPALAPGAFAFSSDYPAAGYCFSE